MLDLMTLDFERVSDGVRYKITSVGDQDVKRPKFTPSAAVAQQLVRIKEPYVDCVKRVYQTAKKACERDPTYDTMCDFTPGCHGSMLAAAGATCIIN